MNSSRDKEYRKALELARVLLVQPDLKERCRIAGATWEPADDGGTICLPFFHHACEITIPALQFRLRGREELISISNQILILHYLNGIKPIPPANKLVSFKEIPSGEFYYPAFAQRSIKPLLRVFGRNPEGFKQAAAKLGGKPAAGADVGVILHVFPQVPVTLLFWCGDDEFPPDLTILFDATLPEVLSTEDIAVMSQEVMLRMIRP